MSNITIFSWGYWGWGTRSKSFVAAATAVEQSRGFGPPMFVDIRFSRSVRAPGFRDKTFETLLGPKNYLWMRSLGNRAIGTAEGGITINEPGAVESLLDLAIKLNKEKRRIIFFCACDIPLFSGTTCHRYTVAGLLTRAATRRQLSVQVVEWPGGVPTMIDLSAKDEMERPFSKGQRLVPAKQEPLDFIASIPWFSPVRFGGVTTETKFFFAGPARCDAKGWGYLNLPVNPPKFNDSHEALRWAKKQRELGSLNPQVSRY